MISEFRDQYYFLSNFYETPVTWEGITYQNNEAAFQSGKVATQKERAEFANLNPSEAKRKGRRVKLVENWEEIKNQVMYEVCLAKFTQHPELMDALLDTEDELLVEGNTWGDQIWGVSKGKGENRLGKILMLIRQMERSKRGYRQIQDIKQELGLKL